MNIRVEAPRRGIVAGGNWIVDHVKLIDAWPPQDALVNIISETWGNGGSPYNVLKNLNKLGAPFPLEAIGLIGDDADGILIRTDCVAHNINVDQLRTSRVGSTSYTDVMTVSGTGRRTFFHQRGVNAQLSPAHFDLSSSRAKILHYGYLLLLDNMDADDPSFPGRPRVFEVLAKARRAGFMTSVDCVSENSARFAAVVRPVLSEVDLFFVNDGEAERITGFAVRDKTAALDRAAVEKAGTALAGYGVNRWVFLHAPEAVCAVSAGGEIIWQPSLQIPADVINGAAGAGDALASGILFALHEGQGITSALLLGICTAAASLFDVTCSSSVLPMDECLRLSERYPFQKSF